MKFSRRGPRPVRDPFCPLAEGVSLIDFDFGTVTISLLWFPSQSTPEEPGRTARLLLHDPRYPRLEKEIMRGSRPTSSGLLLMPDVFRASFSASLVELSRIFGRLSFTYTLHVELEPERLCDQTRYCVPGLIHVVFSNPQAFKDGIFSLPEIQSQNPDWKLVTYDAESMEVNLQKYLSVEDYNLIRGATQTEKCDVLRLLLMYYVGGIYTDIDRVWNIPVASWLKPDDAFVLTTYAGDGSHDIEATWGISYDLIAAAPSNPLFLRALDWALAKRKCNMHSGDPKLTTLEWGPWSFFETLYAAATGEFRRYDEVRYRFTSPQGFHAEMRRLLAYLGIRLEWEDVRQDRPNICLTCTGDPNLWNAQKSTVYARYGLKWWWEQSHPEEST